MTGEQIWGVLRAILASLAGVAVGKGWIDNETAMAVIGGIGTIFVAGWSFWSKKKAA